MNMYSEKLSKYYDILYSHKDYKSECELIKKYSTKNKNLLDVGCGTMTHSIILSEYFKNVTSIDLSKPMIDTGLKKIKSKKPPPALTSWWGIRFLDLETSLLCFLS